MVVICTDHVHMPAGVKAMKVDQHVYREKPLSYNTNGR